MSIIRDFTLYLHAGISVPPVVHVNQYDQGEVWRFTLLEEDGSQYTPSSGALIGVKADGHAIAGVTGTVMGDGRVSITETQQMTAAAGKAVFELTIDGGAHGTANFIVQVEPKPTDSAILSDSDLSIIQEGLNSVTPVVIEEKVSDWLEENFTEPPVDPTLSISNAAADAKVTGDKITELKTDLESVVFIALPSSFEQGAWSNNDKTIENKRIRYSTRIDVSVGDCVTFAADNDLYYSVSVYADASSTTLLESSGWIKGIYEFNHNGVGCLSVANSETYAESTTIRPTDLTTTIIFFKEINKELNDYYNAGIKNTLNTIAYNNAYIYNSANVDVTLPVPDDTKYIYVSHGNLVYGSGLTSFAVLDVTGGSSDIIRKYGSQAAENYIIPVSEGVESVRFVSHTTGTVYPVYIGFINKQTVISYVCGNVLNTLKKENFNSEFNIANSDSNTRSHVYRSDGMPMLFRYASSHLGSGITIQDVQYTEDGTYIISSENSGVVFVDNLGNVTFKSVSDFGHGISIQKLTNGNFMVASVDSNYGTENANRNVYHYDYETNTVIDYFTPSITELLTFAWDFENGTYLLIGQENGNLKHAKAYLYTQETDTAVLIGSVVLPSQYIQGGCVIGKNIYVSCNDGWNNIKDSYIMVFDLSTFEQISAITLTGMFKEVEGVSIYNKNGDAYIRTGETHLVRLFDIKI